jgi:phospholipid transport system substrate-binding protein
MLNLRSAVFFIALVLFGGLTPHVASAQSAASQFVQQLGDRAILELTDKKISDGERVKRMRAMLTENFDVQAVGAFVLAANWNKATDQEKSDFLKYYEVVVSHTYAGLFKKYSGETFQVLRERQLGGDDTVVYGQINQPAGGPPVPVELTARKESNGYKAVDIRVDGISMPLTHRKEYASVIQRNQGRVDGLIKALKAKAESLESQTASQ